MGGLNKQGDEGKKKTQQRTKHKSYKFRDTLPGRSNTQTDTQIDKLTTHKQRLGWSLPMVSTTEQEPGMDSS